MAVSMSIQNEVEFPNSLRDVFPAAAQTLYIEKYKQSWAKAGEGSSSALSREGVASRDAWDAVRREFVQDDVTHKWRRIGEQTPAQATHAEKRSVFGAIKNLFKRS